MAKTLGPGRYAVHLGARSSARSEPPSASSSASLARPTESGTRLRVGAFSALAEAPLPAALARKYGCASEPEYAGINSALYVGRDPDSGAEVLVKVLRPGAFALESDRLRLQRDIERTLGLRHVALPRMLDTGEDEGLTWLVREHVAGESLEARLERTGTLPINEAMLVASQLTGALGALHEVGVIHRDVRPGHVVIGPSGTVALLDAGLGRPLPLRDGRMARGVVEYAAPEVVGAGIGSQWTDLYALGATLFEMLTGAPPFALDGKSAPRHRAVREPAPLPPTVARLLDSLLAANMRDRPRSAHVLLAQLDESAEVVLPSAPPPARVSAPPPPPPSVSQRAAVATPTPAPPAARASAPAASSSGASPVIVPPPRVSVVPASSRASLNAVKPSSPQVPAVAPSRPSAAPTLPAPPEDPVVFELLDSRARRASTQPPPAAFDARAASRDDEDVPVELADLTEIVPEGLIAPPLSSSPPSSSSSVASAAPRRADSASVALFAPVPPGRQVSCEPLEGPTTVVSRDSPLLAELTALAREGAAAEQPDPPAVPDAHASPTLIPAPEAVAVAVAASARISEPPAAAPARAASASWSFALVLAVVAALAAGTWHFRAQITRTVAQVAGAHDVPPPAAPAVVPAAAAPATR